MRKTVNLLALIKECLRNGKYFYSRHCFNRQVKRSITRPEVEYVLKNGWHEKSKDDYKTEYKAWNYAIRGKSIDQRELRIIISFDENNMLIITTIDLTKD